MIKNVYNKNFKGLFSSTTKRVEHSQFSKFHSLSLGLQAVSVSHTEL